MSEDKHTPWGIEDAMSGSREDGWTIEIVNSAGLAVAATTEEHANRIASVPDLEESLREMLDFYGPGESGAHLLRRRQGLAARLGVEVPRRLERVVVERAVAALAKARGEEPST